MQALRALRAKDDNALVALVAQPGVQAALDGARAGGREGGREAEVCAIARRAAAIARQVTAQQQQRMRTLGGGGGGGGGGISDGARMGSIATQDGRATPPVGGEVPGEVHPLLLALLQQAPPRLAAATFLHRLTTITTTPLHAHHPPYTPRVGSGRRATRRGTALRAAQRAEHEPEPEPEATGGADSGARGRAARGW